MTYPPIVFDIPDVNLPTDDPDRDTDKHRRIRERWEHAFPHARPSSCVDREEFFELANQYFSLADSGIPFSVTHHAPEPNPDLIYLGRYTRATACLYGERQGLHGFLWPNMQRVEAALQWYRVRAMRKASGRWMQLLDMPGEGGASLGELTSATRRLSDYARDADEHVFVKVVTASKYGNVRLTIPKGSSREQVHTILAQALGYSIMDLEGRRESLLVSGIVDMRYEYRLIVVDGRIVAGAGCVDKLDPYFAVSAPLDPQMEAVRGDGTIINTRETMDLARRYVRFGNRLLREIADEAPDLRDFTLDVALVPDSQGLATPVVIECNPLLNFGQYCLPYAPVMRSILTAARRLQTPRATA